MLNLRNSAVRFVDDCVVKHEKTIVYGKCLQLMETARDATAQFPPGFAFLADQLRRSTASVARNFAEGYYYYSKRQQRRYFGYAIQSARESSASFDTARAFQVCESAILTRGRALALDVVRMLSKWAANDEDRRDSHQSAAHGIPADEDAADRRRTRLPQS